VKVKDDGTVKVLDFGLAKAMDPVGEASAEMANSPTLTARATQMGMILGTAAYMAPEQARGKAVDKRADIWAFGAVLFEILTGSRAFPGDAIADSVARIIGGNPDYDTLPPDVPPSIRQLVRRCLEKDHRERLRDIGEARIEIKQALATAPSDAYRKTDEPPGTGGEAVPVVGEQENRRRQELIESCKLGGLITAAVGIGLSPFLYFLLPDRPVWVVGLIPLMVGLALLLYGSVLAPRPAPGREHR
jgi:serine/threonine protein kinase